MLMRELAHFWESVSSHAIEHLSICLISIVMLLLPLI